MNRLLPVLLVLSLADGHALAADDFKLEPGFVRLDNGANLDGWYGSRWTAEPRLVKILKRSASSLKTWFCWPSISEIPAEIRVVQDAGSALICGVFMSAEYFDRTGTSANSRRQAFTRDSPDPHSNPFFLGNDGVAAIWRPCTMTCATTRNGF